MRCSDNKLCTPIYLKLSEKTEWPQDESAFYVLSRDGLFLCRNTPFFRSCVPVEAYPSELAGQKPFLQLSYPRIPRRFLERVVGFFDIIGERYASEAAVLIAWNRATNTIELIVPQQVGLVGTSFYGKPCPMELEYEVPALPPHLILLGDIHSHVNGPAYASYLDRHDERHRPGLHLVIGRILDEPPQIHCEATADGLRFRVRDLSLVLEGYHRRRVNEVPPEWIDKVTVKPWRRKYAYDTSQQTGYLINSGASSFLSADSCSSMSSPRLDDLEAKALKPADRTEIPQATPPAAASPPEPIRNDPAGPPANPPESSGNPLRNSPNP